MLKKISIVFVLIFMSCNFEAPVEFSEKALHENLESIEGVSSSFEEIINTYKGKKILVDVWASWCRDCIEGIPKVKKIQKEFP